MSIRTLSVEQAIRALSLIWLTNLKFAGKAYPLAVALVGQTGCGKTSAVEQFHERVVRKLKGCRLIMNILSYLEASDIGGIPFPNKEKTRVSFLRTNLLPWDDETAIVFGDEFDRATPDVQNAYLQVLLGGKIHDHQVSPNAFFILAMNGATDDYTTPLSEAARTRMCTLFMSSHNTKQLDSWEAWAENNDVDPTVIELNKMDRESIANRDDALEELAIDQDRTRVMAGRVLSTASDPDIDLKTDDILLPVIAGFVGQTTALKMLALNELTKHCVHPQCVLENPVNKNVTLPSNESAQMYAEWCISYARSVSSDGVELIDFGRRFDPEVANAWINSVIQAFPNLVHTPTYNEWLNGSQG